MITRKKLEKLKDVLENDYLYKSTIGREYDVYEIVIDTLDKEIDKLKPDTIEKRKKEAKDKREMLKLEKLTLELEIVEDEITFNKNNMDFNKLLAEKRIRRFTKKHAELQKYIKEISNQSIDEND